jgi:hypothetical protein
MSEEPKQPPKASLKRVPVILRSWDGPNSRIGLELDLTQMPWGPFDALGKRLDILLPTSTAEKGSQAGGGSEVERALRFVEHAADRCGEFAALPGDNRDSWLRSQATWEWIRRYLTETWVSKEVGGNQKAETPPPPDRVEPEDHEVPRLPGAAATLQAASKALRRTPLSVWREAVGAQDPDAPTREEAVQTLLGVARILGGGPGGDGGVQADEKTPSPGEAGEAETEDRSQDSQPASSPDAQPPTENQGSEDPDPDQVSYDYARGYDEGYQMGRRVGRALGSRRPPSQGR